MGGEKKGAQSEREEIGLAERPAEAVLPQRTSVAMEAHWWGLLCILSRKTFRLLV